MVRNDDRRMGEGPIGLPSRSALARQIEMSLDILKQRMLTGAESRRTQA
jgi:hypothetical protein